MNTVQVIFLQVMGKMDGAYEFACLYWPQLPHLILTINFT